MNNVYKRMFTALLLCVCFYVSYLVPLFFDIFLSIIIFFIAFYEWPLLAKNKTFMWLTFFIYPVFPFIRLFILNKSLHREHMFLLFMLVGAFDTGSYIFGKLFGYRKLLPSVSPGKTWEGLAGGFISVIATHQVYLLVTGKSMYGDSFYFSIGIVLYIAVTALVGDIFVSFLKRTVSVKDTGAILPGHGGFLDRFDGLFFTLLPWYLALLLPIISWLVISKKQQPSI